MRIVVLGATGNVGTSVLTALSNHDVEVVGVARRDPRLLPAASVFHRADIATDDLEAIFTGADVVVHLAWLFQPSHNPMTTWENNVIGTERVLRACGNAGVPSVVYASSVGAYSPGPADDFWVDEAWPTHSAPMAAYGREKAYVERLLDTFERAHPQVRVVRLRPAFIFKKRAATEQRRLFLGPFMPNALVRPGRLPVLPLPRGLQFQAVHSADVGHAYALAALGDAQGAFNIAADDVVRVGDIAAILQTRAVELPRRAFRVAAAGAWHARVTPTDPALLDLFLSLPLMSTERAKAELGWSPTTTAYEAVAELVAGMHEGTGAPTVPLAPDSARTRLRDIAAGVGQRAS